MTLISPLTTMTPQQCVSIIFSAELLDCAKIITGYRVYMFP